VVSNQCLLKHYQEPAWIQVTPGSPGTAEFARATSPCGKQPRQTEGLQAPSCHTPASHRQKVKLEAPQSARVLPVAEGSVLLSPREYQLQHPSGASHLVLPAVTGDRD